MKKSSQSKMPLPPSEHGELAQYIFKNYESLFTKDEQKAWTTIIEGRPCGGEKQLSNGELAFYGKVTKRIMKAHSKDIILNRCPKCGSLCRTPSARLCPNPKCNHTWYEKR
jgi:hypothetical protein